MRARSQPSAAAAARHNAELREGQEADVDDVERVRVK
jgi:hypothetical protein